VKYAIWLDRGHFLVGGCEMRHAGDVQALVCEFRKSMAVEDRTRSSVKNNYPPSATNNKNNIKNNGKIN